MMKWIDRIYISQRNAAPEVPAISFAKKQNGRPGFVGVIGESSYNRVFAAFGSFRRFGEQRKHSDTCLWEEIPQSTKTLFAKQKGKHVIGLVISGLWCSLSLGMHAGFRLALFFVRIRR